MSAYRLGWLGLFATMIATAAYHGAYHFAALMFLYGVVAIIDRYYELHIRGRR